MWSRRLTRLVLVVTIALAVAGLVIGCDLGGGGGTKTYDDPDYGFTFDYPADWQVVTSGASGANSGADPTAVVSVGDPDGAQVEGTGIDLFMVRVYELTQTVDESMLPDILPYLESLMADLQSQDPTWKVEDEFTEARVGGVPGYKITSSFDFNARTPAMTTSYFLFAGDIEYQLVFQAAAENWEKDQAVFAAMLASFKTAAAVD